MGNPIENPIENPISRCATLLLHSPQTTEFMVFILVLQPGAGHILRDHVRHGRLGPPWGRLEGWWWYGCGWEVSQIQTFIWQIMTLLIAYRCVLLRYCVTLVSWKPPGTMVECDHRLSTWQGGPHIFLSHEQQMSCFLNIKQQTSTPAIPKETFRVAPTDKIGTDKEIQMSMAHSTTLFPWEIWHSSFSSIDMCCSWPSFSEKGWYGSMMFNDFAKILGWITFCVHRADLRDFDAPNASTMHQQWTLRPANSASHVLLQRFGLGALSVLAGINGYGYISFNHSHHLGLKSEKPSPSH